MQHTRKTFTRLTALVTIILAGSVSRANATSFTVTDSFRGFFTSTANDSPFTSNSNYVVGYCPFVTCINHGPAEFRNFFQFSVPTLDGPVSSALLTIYTSILSTADSPTMTYQVTSLPAAFGFADLGTGTVFGSRTYTSADANMPASIVLDAAAIAPPSSRVVLFASVGASRRCREVRRVSSLARSPIRPAVCVR